ncbi:MAG: hypothetical protein ING37_08920, partial [Rhodocyclaceae bacterium]|nr:hypothetical protein [Rhodocyclaceae bacterium]
MKVPTDGKAKTILFPTIVDDIHATAVELALREMGHRPVRWLTSNLPERAKCHINFNEEGLNGLAISDYFGEVKLADIDVFWNRRIGAPVITTRLDESDGKVVKIETERFLANMLLCVSESCFSVNDYYAAKRAENKAVQLWKAKSVGLSIPSTIITNSPERIRSFIGQHSPGEVVVKPFMPAMWQTDHDVAIAFTATVTTEQLPPDGILQVAPAIYQRRVEKAYELR